MKNSFDIAGATVCRTCAGHGRQDDRHVEVALVIGGEHDRSVEPVEMLEALDANPREHARERQDPGGQAQPPDQSHEGPPVPSRKVDRFGDLGLRRRLLEKGAHLGHRSRRRELRFVDARLQLVFERDHQLDALERAEPQVLERRAGVNLPATRESRHDVGDGIAAGCGGRGPGARSAPSRERPAA